MKFKDYLDLVDPNKSNIILKKKDAGKTFVQDNGDILIALQIHDQKLVLKKEKDGSLTGMDDSMNFTSKTCFKMKET